MKSETAPRYFGGSTVTSKFIRPLQATDFSELVDTTFAVGRPLDITFDAFHALDDKTRKRHKDGPYVLPATYPATHKVRGYDGAAAAVLVCLDVDDATVARDILRDPDLLDHALPGINHVLHHTVSSTKDNPRIRLIVDADEIPLDRYADALATIASALGLPTEGFDGLVESRVSVQPMYRPVVFKDQESPPLVSVETRGRAFTVEDITIHVERATPQAYEFDGDGMPLEHLPLPGIDAKHIADLLAHLDPDMSYPEWCRVICAIKHQFSGDAEQASEGFEIVDEWSQSGTKYPGSDEMVKKWNSFDPCPKGRTPVTLRTLIKMGQQAGWSSKDIDLDAQSSFQRWLEGADVTTIITECADRLLKLPNLSAPLLDAYVNKIVARTAALGSRVGKVAVLKAYNEARREKTIEQTDCPNWLRHHVFDASVDGFRSTRIPGDPQSASSFNREHSKRMCDLVGSNDAAKPKQEASDYALNIAAIRRVAGTIYDPRSRGEEPFVKMRGLTYLNTYAMTSVPTPDHDGAAKAGRYVTEIAVQLCGPSAAETMLDFFTVCVREPGRKIRWAPVIQSGQGAGKNLLLNAVAGAIGVKNFRGVDPGSLQSNFNDWFLNAHLINVDELHTAGGIRSKEMNAVKGLISNDKVSVNEKYRNVREIDNVANVVITTNHLSSLKLEDSDRRYFVVESPLQRKSQIAAITETGWFRKRGEWLTANPGAVRAWFLARDIPEAFPYDGPAPVTRARNRVIDYSRSDVFIQIEAIIDGGREPMVAEDIVCMKFLRDMIDAPGNRHGTTLEEMGYVRYEEGSSSKFRLSGGVRTPIYYRPELIDPDVESPVEIARERYNNSDRVPV